MKTPSDARPHPPARRRFEAVLFDVDGTLVDSRAFVLGALEHALRLHHLPVPARATLAATIGPPLEECYRTLAPQGDVRALCEAHRAWQRQRAHLVTPFPHTLATLEALRRGGVRLAAVTSRSRVTSLGSLDQAGLSPLLEVTISAEDAPRTKPDPAPLWLALERMNLPAAGALMVGDTRADITAGQAAGLKTAAVLYGFTGAALRAAPADFFIRDIAELTPLVLGEPA